MHLTTPDRERGDSDDSLSVGSEEMESVQAGSQLRKRNRGAAPAAPGSATTASSSAAGSGSSGCTLAAGSATPPGPGPIAGAPRGKATCAPALGLSADRADRNDDRNKRILGPGFEPEPSSGSASSPSGNQGPVQTSTRSIEPPDTLCCPITLLLFRDPVVISTGFTYERSAIKRCWQKAAGSGQLAKCPKTNLMVDPNKVITNWAVRATVEKWLDETSRDYIPDGWDSRELLPTPRRRSSGRQDHSEETITRMQEQVNEMESLARDCAREAVAARDALGAVHLFQRRMLHWVRRSGPKYLALVLLALCSALWKFPDSRIVDMVLISTFLAVSMVSFMIWYPLRYQNWLCRLLAPLVREVTNARNPPVPDERYNLAIRALFSTELVANIQ